MVKKHLLQYAHPRTAEDLPDASFAGQQETFLNITGSDKVLVAIKKVYASLFSVRSISYRNHHAIDHSKVAMSVGVQRMVRSNEAASGVLFTLDTESGFDQSNIYFRILWLRRSNSTR